MRTTGRGPVGELDQRSPVARGGAAVVQSDRAVSIASHPRRTLQRKGSLQVAELVASTAEPAFAVDGRALFVAMNPAAEELLDLSQSEALGRCCHEVVNGRDVFGNRFCCVDCPVAIMARRREPVRRFLMTLEPSPGGELRVEVFAMCVYGPHPRDLTILHVLEPLASRGTCDALVPPEGSTEADVVCTRAAVEGTATAQPGLTRRELEILRLLERGSETNDIARELFITSKTVRNHVQNILRKLDAHSRLEAVYCARRRHIL